MSLALAPGPGCDRSLPAPPAREERGVDSPADRAALRKLFDDAAACGDRYHCPPLDALRARAEKPGELSVLRMAFDLMVDPKLETSDRLFRMAFAVAEAWTAARQANAKPLSTADERELRAQVMRLLARGDNSVPGQSLAAHLSDARQILEREALDPRRGNDEFHASIRILRDLERDLSTVQTWLAAKEPRPQLAAALLLDAMDHATIAAGDEAALLLAYARRADSDPEAARLVAQHAVQHADPTFAPVLAAFAHHADPAVRAAAAPRGHE
ncbi:MAG TPA: hypothetical protein VFP84_23820 [Kofleriaceae bacterium]|nr:hypothetical protein [Kofleriaceae bacterium]